MRVVIIGTNAPALMTARALLHRAHEVIIIERDEAAIDALGDELDCAFVHGDGSKPAIQREVDPEHADFLFCLTRNDQTNIIASLVGRSLGFARVVTMIQDEEFEHICLELGLEDAIIPSRTISRFLADMVEGQDALELSTMIKGDARMHSFVAHQQDEGRVDALRLPHGARVICLYRDGEFMLTDTETAIRHRDEVVVLTHRKHLGMLRETWGETRGNGLREALVAHDAPEPNTTG